MENKESTAPTATAAEEPTATTVVAIFRDKVLHTTAEEIGFDPKRYAQLEDLDKFTIDAKIKSHIVDIYREHVGLLKFTTMQKFVNRFRNYYPDLFRNLGCTQESLSVSRMLMRLGIALISFQIWRTGSVQSFKNDAKISAG